MQISARSLQLCRQCEVGHDADMVNSTTVVIFFHQCFVKKSTWAVCSILFIHNHLNEIFISSGKTHCCNSTFTDVHFMLLLAKTIYFINRPYTRCMQSALSQAYCLKVSFECVSFVVFEDRVVVHKQLISFGCDSQYLYRLYRH